MIDVGYVDSIATLKDLELVDLDWSNDYAIKDQSANNKLAELTLVNLTSPVGRVERIKLSSTRIGDVFTPSGINSAFMPASHEGVKLYAQVSDVYKYTDETCECSEYHLPMTASVSVTIPNTEVLGASEAMDVIGRAVSSLFDTGSVDSARINRMLKGSLLPKS